MSKKRQLSPSREVSLEKSRSDSRDYRYVHLENGITALVVHDPSPDSKKTSCAVSVGVGSYWDFPELQGTAHFLEHMLFMGSEEYPGENDLDSFLSEKNGYVNAMTELEYTIYYFELLSDNSEDVSKALHIFSGFFLKPLIRADCVDREVEAVE